MKKLFTFIFAAMAVLFMNVPFAGTAEAARVAVVPIQVNDELVERAGDFNGYYWDIMIDKFKYPDYELMDDEKIAAKLPDVHFISPTAQLQEDDILQGSGKHAAVEAIEGIF